MLARCSDYIKKLSVELGNSRAYACAVSDSSIVKKVLAQINNELGEIDVIIYNAGSGTWGNIEKIKPEAFEINWRIYTLDLFTVCQAVSPQMKKKGQGNIIVIGATASRRGGINTAALLNQWQK